MSRRLRFHPLWLLPLCLWPFLPVIFGAGVLLFRDLVRVHGPMKYFFASEIHQGRFPLWNNLAYTGSPYAADPNLSAFSPFNFVFLLPLSWFHSAFALYLALEAGFGALGLYVLLRRQNLAREVSLAYAGAFALGGAALSATSVPNVLGAFATLPWFAWAWLGLRNRPSMAAALLNGLAIALPTFFGDPQFSFLLALVQFVSAFLAGRRSILWLLLPLPAAALAGAVQLLPALDLIASTRLAGAISLREAQWFSLHPARLLELFLPLPFGSFAPANDYWGGHFADPEFRQPFLFSLYLGAIPSYFLARALFLQRWKKTSAALALAGVFFLLLSLGRFTPLYALAYDYFPFWANFRYPERIFLFWCVPALAWSAHASAKDHATYPLYFTSAALAALAAASLLFFPATVAISALQFALVLAGFALTRSRLPVRFAHCALPLWILLDLSLTVPRTLWIQPREALVNRAAEKITLDLGRRADELRAGGAFRVAHVAIQPDETGARQREEWDAVTQVVSEQLLSFQPNVQQFHGLASPFGYGSLMPDHLLAIWTGHRNSRATDLLDQFGVRYLPYREANGDITVRVRTTAWPYFRALETVADAADSLAAARQSLETGALSLEEVGPLATNPVQGLHVRSLERQGDEISVTLETDGNGGWVFWGEGYHQNWRARVASDELPVRRANGWASAILLPAGSRQLELRLQYEDLRFQIGLPLSLSFFALLALSGLAPLGRPRRNPG